MATYAVGDIQGCYDHLQRLLEQVSFDVTTDTLWVVGDMVNRGPDSLNTLRFIKSLGASAQVVLGNHDLHLLAVAANIRPLQPSDTLQPILDAPDCDELLLWLRRLPLLHHDDQLGYVMVHAGLAPQWTLDKAKALAQEVTSALQSDNYLDYLSHMYGNDPNGWDDALTGTTRLRVITNYLTRIRYVDYAGRLNLQNKQAPTSADIPWFKHPDRKTCECKIIFGHWAALAGNTQTPRTFALDTGCVWGRSLTLMRLDDGALFSEPCRL